MASSVTFVLFQNLDDLKFYVPRFLHFALRIDVVYAGELQLLMPLFYGRFTSAFPGFPRHPGPKLRF